MNNNFNNWVTLGGGTRSLALLNTLLLEGDAAAVRTAPARFLLIRYGETTFTKDGAVGSFAFDEAAADELIAEFRERGRDTVVDYAHQSLAAGEAPAAGWIKALHKTAAGVEAEVEWTERAARYLQQREYRYHSPVIKIDEAGKATRLHSVAITNTPAMHAYPALVAGDGAAAGQKMTSGTGAGASADGIQGGAAAGTKGDNDTGGVKMDLNELLQQLCQRVGIAVALSDGKVSVTGTVAALQNKIDELKALQAEQAALNEMLAGQEVKSLAELGVKIAGMVPVAEKAELEKKLAGIEAEKAVTQALTDGKLVEAQREWALKFATADLAAFAEFAEKAPVVAPGTLPAGAEGKGSKMDDAGGGGGEVKELSDVELEIARRTGLSDEQIEEMKYEAAGVKPPKKDGDGDGDGSSK